MIAPFSRCNLLSRFERRLTTCLALIACCCGIDVVAFVEASEPLSPAAALADFALSPGYRIELVASEPQIVDPVAMAFDAQGRLWVVEMRDYPFLADGAKPSSRIRILEDKNQDGVFETAGTFADGLLIPTGLQLWGSGAFVTLAGEVAYFSDDDCDGRADKHQTWYRGFATENEQLRANHPTHAADGWIYVAGGLRGGQIENLRRPGDAPVSINGRDFAFNPRTGACRAVSGNGQFGLAIDDFGRRFTCSNRNPLIEVMIEQRYFDLNPKLVLPSVVQDAAAAGADSRIFPRSRAMTTSAEHSGQFTAACGVELDRGHAFICEPTGNLVHREIVKLSGSAMQAVPIERDAEQGAEFLTATDEWFRPVNLATGPDGALYVVDMYRAVIEHPEWMPSELRQRSDLLDGVDRGRIYRIIAEGTATNAPVDNRVITTDSPAELATLLSHPNAWQRETAARRLLEIGSAAAIEPLVKVAATDVSSAAARYLAFSTLEALGALTPELLARCLRDPAPEVRTLGLQLAEPRLAKSTDLADLVLQLANDPDPRVRYQTALTSMFLPSTQTLPALRSIASQDAEDEWTCRAVALAARDQAGRLLIELLARELHVQFTPALARELVAAVVANDDGHQLAAALGSLDRVDQATARLLLLAANDALQQRGSSLAASLAMVAEQAPAARQAIDNLFDASLAKLVNVDVPEAERIAEAPVLQLDARPGIARLLLALLSGDASTPLQVAAIDSLRSQSSPEIADTLLARYPEQLPIVRRATLDLLTSRPDWTVKFLDAVATEQIAAGDVDPTRRLQLMQHHDVTVRTAAERLFAAEMKDREEVVRRYQAALELTGDAERGHAVYAANCASCHRIGTEGTAVGPDIGDASMKISAQLLTDILDPNRAVDANFVNYVALTVDGVGHQGIITSESETGLVLLGADGKTVTILREDLESLTSGKSLMPEGVEQQIDPQKMADLLTFLKTWRHAAELRSKRSDEAAATAVNK
jgi:putative membrane-bound dehydrogenase-like protein